MKVGMGQLGGITEFQKEKDKFYLLSLIASQEGSMLYSDLENYFMGRCEKDMPCWIWTKDPMTQDIYQKLKEDIEKFVEDGETKYTCKKELYELLKEDYQTSNYYEMGYLSCENLIKPKERKGIFVRPSYQDRETLAKYWMDNEKEIDHKEITKEEALEEVDLWLKGKRFYVLMDNSGKIVSMAGYSIVGDTAKITHVYTPVEERRKGYCTNLIYELTKKLQDEDLKPLLYTDYHYEASNKAYQSIGYQDEGFLINFVITK